MICDDLVVLVQFVFLQNFSSIGLQCDKSSLDAVVLLPSMSGDELVNVFSARYFNAGVSLCDIDSIEVINQSHFGEWWFILIWQLWLLTNGVADAIGQSLIGAHKCEVIHLA